jgi:hypothetical protein
MEYARTSKLEILFLDDISKAKKRLSSCISLQSDCSLVSLVEIEGAQSGPEVLVTEVVFELGVEEHVFVLADFHVFLYVSLAVHFGLEVQRLVRERQFQLVQLLDVVFRVLLVKVESSLVIHDRTSRRHRFYFYGFNCVVQMHVIVS